MAPPAVIQTKDLSEFHAWARAFARGLRGDELVLLSGPMGAGKTELVKTWAAELGARGPASSPTYAFHQSYDLGTGATLEHWDLYRVRSEEELDGIGFWDLLDAAPGVVCVEWPERAPATAWPLGRRVLRLRLEPAGAARTILINHGP